MANDHIETYLNDHLAGSVAALELLEHLKATHEGTNLEDYFALLYDDVSSDQRELKRLMSDLGVTESIARKSMAWIAEKISEFKLRIEDPEGTSLRLLEALEILATGIEGKRSLWVALETASTVNPRLQGVDYERLEQRATEQRQRVEERRLEAAKAALTPSSEEDPSP